MSSVSGGGSHGLYGFLDYIARQIMPDTAEAEELARWASIFGLARKPAVAAAGPVNLTGTDTSPADAGAVLQRGDDFEYSTTADVTIAGGVAVAVVEAVAPGAAGNADAGVRLTFASPIAGVASTAFVAEGGLTGGSDEESDDELRARLLARIRSQPNGGAANDYERWALEVPGVTRAWVYPNLSGLGTVGVAFVMDGRTDIIPTVDDVAAVQAHIAPLRPVTADVTVFAPTPVDLDLTIAVVPNTDEVKAAVGASLKDMLLREAEPGGTILLSHIREAISIAAGETDNIVTVPAADVTVSAGELVILGTITWV